MRSAMRVTAVIAASITMTVPAHAQKTAVYEARFQPKFPAVTELGSVGVLNFNGKDGDYFTSALTAALQSAQLDGRNILSVKTIDSMNYRSAADISRAEVAQAIRQGQKLGVKVIFTGTVSAASTTTTNFVREETACVESSGLFKCKRSERRQIPCAKVVGQYSVTPRALRVDNGAIVYSQAVASQGEYTMCGGQLQTGGTLGELFGGIFGKKKADSNRPPISSPDALLNALRTEVAEKVRLDIAPYNRSITVTFMEKGGKLPKAEDQQFGNAIAFAGAGRLDRTCAIFETLFTGANQSNIALLYNMGACQEVLLPDDPSAALQYYSKADQLLARPNKLVSDAYLRTKAAVGRDRSFAK